MLMVVQNDPEVPPGLLTDVIRERKVPFRLIQLYSGDQFQELEGASGVVVLGGSMSVRDVSEYPYLQWLKTWIGEVVEQHIPFLGICLGGQLLAEVLGGKVHLHYRGERGCQQIEVTEAGTCDPLFANLPKRFFSFEWHSDSFELPPGAVHLAGSADCSDQAFRYGKAAYGIQFHPEVTREIISQWSSAMDDGQMSVLHSFVTVEPAFRAASLALIGSFLEML
jgi:GMP synthase (glutamine-hydrolysing)